MKDKPNLSALLRRVDKVLAGERLAVMDDDLIAKIRFPTKSPAKKKPDDGPTSKNQHSSTTGGKRAVSVRDMATMSERLRLYWRQIQLGEQLASKLYKENDNLGKLNASLSENVKTLNKDLAFADWKIGNMSTEIKQLNTTNQNYRKSVDEAKAETAQLRENYKKLQDTDLNRTEQVDKLKCELLEKELHVKRLETLLVSGQQVDSEDKKEEVKFTNGCDIKREHVESELASDDFVLNKKENAIDSPPWVLWSPKPPPIGEQSPPYEPFTF